MKEFAQKGFKNASTDTIVKEADISKGALFHYFNNKKDLYLFLYDYAIDILKNMILMKFNYHEKDVFNRIRQGTLLKCEILKKHPEMYNFILAAYTEASDGLKKALENRNKEQMASYQWKIYEGIDISKFKEDVDVERAINVIAWTIEGFTNRKLEKIRGFSLYEVNLNELLTELDIYLEMLKKSFYK